MLHRGLAEIIRVRLCCARILCGTATIETGQIAMDAKSSSDVKTLRGHIYGLQDSILFF